MRCSHAALGSRVALAPIAQTHALQGALLPCLAPKRLHVCVCAQMLGNKHTLARDAVLAVHTGSFLLMYRHGHPAAASAQKPALVLEQYWQSLQRRNKWISLKMSCWEERQSLPH